MKFCLLSDLHIHRSEPDHQAVIDDVVRQVNAWGQGEADLIVLAGDLSHETAAVEGFLRRFDTRVPRVWVPGNHDLWLVEPEGPEDSARRRYDELLPAISRRTGWHYLPTGPLILAASGQTWGIVGNIGWFATGKYSEWTGEQAGAADECLAEEMAADLERDLAQVKDRRVDHVLVVLHHPPASPELPVPTHGNEQNPPVARVLLDHAAAIDLVVHGHRHRRYGPQAIGPLQFLAHPLGYPDQHAGWEDGVRLVDGRAR